MAGMMRKSRAEKRRDRASGVYVKHGSFPLPRPFAGYARSLVCGERTGIYQKATFKLSTETVERGSGKLCRKKGDKPFFHRLRPPGERHKKGRSSQKWRNPTGLKDTGRFHAGGSLVRSPVPPLQMTHINPLLWPRFLIPRLMLGFG